MKFLYMWHHYVCAHTHAHMDNDYTEDQGASYFCFNHYVETY